MKPENWHLYAMLCCLLFVFACDRGAQPRQEQDVTRASANPSAPLDASSATPAKSGQVNPANRDKILSMLTGFEHVPSAEDLYEALDDVRDQLGTSRTTRPARRARTTMSVWKT